jgi:hypothetical protein
LQFAHDLATNPDAEERDVGNRVEVISIQVVNSKGRAAAHKREGERKGALPAYGDAPTVRPSNSMTELRHSDMVQCSRPANAPWEAETSNQRADRNTTMPNFYAYMSTDRVFAIADDIEFGLTKRAPGRYAHSTEVGSCAYVAADRGSLLKVISCPS